jgi:hypothetical protein
MSNIVVREQDILKVQPPGGKPEWTEDMLRAAQESKGINYGNTMYERGVKPNREWSNDSTFSGPIAKFTSAVDNTSEVAALKAELEELKQLFKEVSKPKADYSIPLNKQTIAGGLDMRTKEGKALKAQMNE